MFISNNAIKKLKIFKFLLGFRKANGSSSSSKNLLLKTNKRNHVSRFIRGIHRHFKDFAKLFADFMDCKSSNDDDCVVN